MPFDTSMRRTHSFRALGLVVAITAAATAGCDSPSRGTERSNVFDRATSRRAIEPVRISMPSVLYVDGAVLHRADLATGERDRLGRLATREVFASPAGRWVAEVVPGEGDVGAERDFVLQPELRLLELVTGREVVVGRGFAPLWHPRDGVLAYLRPRSPRRCSGEACATRSEVVRLDVRSGREDVLLPAGRWTLLSWLGDGVLVSDADRSGRVVLVGAEGEPRTLPFAPSEIWGGSPDGRWLIAARGRTMEFHSVDDGSVERDGVPLRLGGALMAEGSWAPDSSLVAATTLDPSLGAARGSRVVRFAVPDPDPSPIPGLRGVAGPVLLSPDAGTVVTSRVAGPGGFRLQAVSCGIEANTGCRALFSWVRGVTLLAVAQ